MDKDNTLYELMNWEAMEALVYSENNAPHEWLGGHVTDKGVLYNTYQPTAVAVELVIGSKKYDMIGHDEEDFHGNFSVLVPGKKVAGYKLLVTYDNGTQKEIKDPYAFSPFITEEDEERFNAGIHYEIYEKLGAHPDKRDGVTGTRFAVWAPNAMRVSVVGDFNLWDGRRHPMRKLANSGIFELFIPDVNEGEIYKYEIKAKGGLTFLKADPYANYAELRPATASIVKSLDYKWTDKSWLKQRKDKYGSDRPMSIYEMHLGSWRRKGDGDNDFYTYRELAPMIAKYVKDMGYTHIELMPVMEHPYDASWGYQVTGYYAATSRYGTPQDFMYFIDYLHNEGIGVILDWVPAHFPRDTHGLSNFDGTCLYEHRDPRQGSHPHWGTLIYNYGRPQVSNFLIANALFWVEKYHADGIRMDAVASMLYLDYGKNNGQWVANKYGGHENLEAIELFKHLNSIFHKREDGAILIAEESTAWPMVTGDVEKGGLGFDYKWNMGWMNDFLNYMRQDPLFRKGCHGALTFGMMYAYSEKFVLVFSHDEVVHGKGSMINKMPGTIEDKFANLRVAYGFMMGHPGKKLLFMGQDFAQDREWSETRELDWGVLDNELNRKMLQYKKDLNHIYLENRAFYAKDSSPEGFRWISCLDADRSVVSFYRSTDRKEETLLFVVNFTPVVYKDFNLGVPFTGKYKEILNSDAVKYGGKGNTNPRAKTAKAEAADGWENSIQITLPPLGMAVFSVVADKDEKKSPKMAKAEKIVKKAVDEALKKAEKASKKAEKTAESDKAGKSETEAEPAVKDKTRKTADKEAKIAEKEAKAAEKASKKADKAAESDKAGKQETEAEPAVEDKTRKTAEKEAKAAEKASKTAEKEAKAAEKASKTAEKASKKAEKTAESDKAGKPETEAEPAVKDKTRKTAEKEAKAAEKASKTAEKEAKAAEKASKKAEKEAEKPKKTSGRKAK